MVREMIISPASSSSAPAEGPRGGGGGAPPSTPDGHRRDAGGRDDDAREEAVSTSLLFRFGNRFVFRVDESAIVGIEYEPGSVGGGGAPGGVEAGRYSDDDGSGDGKGTDGSPPRKKRQVPT